MLRPTTSKHTAQLNTQLNVNENHKSTSFEEAIPMQEKSRKNTVHERQHVEGTPFTIAKTDKGYTLLMGLYALTPTFKTKTQLKTFMNKNEWNLMVNIIHAMLDFHKLINTKEILKKEEQKTEI